jgi:hypothetical protein
MHVYINGCIRTKRAHTYIYLIVQAFVHSTECLFSILIQERSMVKTLAESDQLPWDPLWEYVLGEDKDTIKPKRTFLRKESTGNEDSWFNWELDDRNNQSSTRANSASRDIVSDGIKKGLFCESKKREGDLGSFFMLQATDEPQQKMGFFRGKKKGEIDYFDDEYSSAGDSPFALTALSFFDQPNEISKADFERKEDRKENEKEKKSSRVAAPIDQTEIEKFDKTDQQRQSSIKGDEDGSLLSYFSGPTQGTYGKRSRRKRIGTGRLLFAGGAAAAFSRRSSKRSATTENAGYSTLLLKETATKKDKSGGKQIEDSNGLLDELGKTFDSWLESMSGDEECSSEEESIASSEEGGATDGEATDESETVSSANSLSEESLIENAFNSLGSGERSAQRKQRREQLVNYTEVRETFQLKTVDCTDAPELDDAQSPMPDELGAGNAPITENSPQECKVDVDNLLNCRESKTNRGASGQNVSEAPLRHSSLELLDRATSVQSALLTSQPHHAAQPQPTETRVLSRFLHQEMGSDVYVHDDFIQQQTFSAPEKSQSGLGAGRIMCRGFRGLTEKQLEYSRRYGIPVHELTNEELALIFPKLRSVPKDNASLRVQSVVMGNSNSFEKNLPASYQVTLDQDVPQSLFEYEYESGAHKVLVYEEFGTQARSLLKIHCSGKPPERNDEELINFNSVVVQVEVRGLQ